MSADTPEVSVIVAAWNAAPTIGGAVSSALRQRGVRVEVIAIDDASTDGTRAELERLAEVHKHLHIVVQTVNSGPAAARNSALALARAPYVTILDADDEMAPDRLGKLLSIARLGNWDIVADDLFKVPSHHPDAPRERLWSKTEIGCVKINFEEFIQGNLTRLHGGRGELGFLKPLIRREFLEWHNLRYDQSMRLGEDYALYAEALAAGARFCLTDPFGYHALVRPESLSGRHEAADLAGLVRVDQQLASRSDLTTSERKMLKIHEIETQKRWRWLRLIEAVKSRDIVDAVRCFIAPPSVIASLCARLGEQVLLRSAARISRVLGTASA
ncbi:hypothetical protein OCH239_12965 [Roseivivax halodurans JCM 10272]|uniref:Glycosyltransferase 2-like domain-containing protein n=1 Tax=Roseivivax halodurans JCM 10272 TaxID=1449350 RepID=X7EBC3_9RHOB|nr:glycosyltransferase family 2 protein [Roseivivax halodurans]ETX13175.1 hypothetical protein OCH239_12965 [Roseivivax halodurans JCM 10272]